MNIRVTWTTTVELTREQTFDLDKLPHEIRESWRENNILTDESSSDQENTERLRDWLEDFGEKGQPARTTVTHRVIESVEEVGNE